MKANIVEQMPNQQLVRMVQAGLQQGKMVTVAVNGRSMHPLLQNGDQVVIEPVECAQLTPGDLITVVANGELLTHRFWQWTTGPGNGQYLQTRGDNRHQFDAPVAPGQLIGRVLIRHRCRLRLDRGIGRLLNRHLYRFYALIYHFETFFFEEPGQPHRIKPQFLHRLAHYWASALTGLVSRIAHWLPA